MRPRLVTLLLLLPLLIVGLAAQQREARAASPAAPAAPAAAPAPSLTTAETQQLLSVLQDPQKRAQFVTTLKNLEKAGAATGTTTVAPAKAAPAAKATVALQPNSLGADILSQANTALNQVEVSLHTTVATVTEYRALVDWLSWVSRDPTVLGTVASASWRLAFVLVLALMVEYLVWRFSGRLYARLGRESAVATTEAKAEIAPEAVAAAEAAEGDAGRSGPPLDEEGAEGTEAESLESARAERAKTAAEAPDADAPETAATEAEAARPGLGRLKPFHSGWLLLRRLPFILLAMLVDALPPAGFLAAGTLLLATPIGNDILMRLMIGAVVNAYVLCRMLMVVARATFCSPSAKLRLLHLSDEAAGFLALWVRRIALVILLGFCLVQIGNLCGMSIEVQHGIGRVISLIIHLMLVVMVLKRRHEVESWLRGRPAARHTTWQLLKNRLASVWHWQAIILIMLAWLVYATVVTNHAAHPTRLILGTLGILVLFRVLHIVLLGGLEKAFAPRPNFSDTRYVLIATRAARYHAPLRYLLNLIITVTLVLTLLQFWGFDALYWLQVGQLGTRLISSVSTICVTLIVAVAIWETINFVLQIYMDDLSQQGAYMRAARLRTVVPLLRNTLLITLLVIFVLTALSEIGVNIGPLLAGASIIGVALGFGSQKLVQDFINGIFLLLENAMQVGDWVTAGGLSGTVENLSIRTLRLRASDGSVHIIPFSSVTTVTNTNRGLGNAAVSVTISYEEDTDAVAALLKQIVLDLRAEDAFKDGMLSDFQYWGVDRIDGTTATLAGQVVCTDKGRWGVQRELNRRIKLAFQEKGIRLIPGTTILSLQHPLDVRVELPDAPARDAAPAAQTETPAGQARLPGQSGS